MDLGLLEQGLKACLWSSVHAGRIDAPVETRGFDCWAEDTGQASLSVFVSLCSLASSWYDSSVFILTVKISVYSVFRTTGSSIAVTH